MQRELARYGTTDAEHEAAALVVEGVEAIGRRSLDLEAAHALGLFALSIPTTLRVSVKSESANDRVVGALARALG